MLLDKISETSTNSICKNSSYLLLIFYLFLLSASNSDVFQDKTHI